MRRTKEDWLPFSNLQGFVRLVLLIDWDPIGVLGRPRAMDEYDSYVDAICDMIQSGATSEMLAAHLDSIEERQMGLRRKRRANTEVAAKLLEIYAATRTFQAG